jgi:hypothetical protein
MLIASHISPHHTVIDFGAGNQTIRHHAGVRIYTPVDCVQSRENVFLCDYIREMRFPNTVPDIIVMSGFLEYILETEDFLRALKRTYPGTRCIFSWAFEPQSPEARQESGWIAKLNPASPEVAPFGNHFDRLTVIEEYATQYS